MEGLLGLRVVPGGPKNLQHFHFALITLFGGQEKSTTYNPKAETWEIFQQFFFFISKSYSMNYDSTTRQQAQFWHHDGFNIH